MTSSLSYRREAPRAFTSVMALGWWAVLAAMTQGCRSTDAQLEPAAMAQNDVSRADHLLRRGDAAAAFAQYDEFLAEDAPDPRLRLRALLGRARARLALGDVTTAKVDARIARTDAMEVYADDLVTLSAFLDRVDAVLDDADRPRPAPLVAMVAPSPPPVRVALPPPIASPPPPPAAPQVESRQRWNAAALLSNHDPMTPIRRVTVHHTGTHNDDLGYDDTAVAIRSIQRYHQDSRGWADIGYHYLIDRSGRVWEGRDIEIQGAHAGNSQLNRGNIGVAVIGNYEEQRLLPNQRSSLYRLLDDLCRRHHIDRREILTHHEILAGSGAGGTACPGGDLSHAVEDYRGHAHGP